MNFPLNYFNFGMNVKTIRFKFVRFPKRGYRMSISINVYIVNCIILSLWLIFIIYMHVNIVIRHKVALASSVSCVK